MTTLREAAKLALEALECLKKDFDADQFEWEIADVAITALKQGIAQDALDKKAENARELGLSYDDNFCDKNCVWTDHHPDCKAVQEPVEVDQATMELAESVGLIGPASRTHDLHAAIQRFHDLICVNATIKAAQMAADAIREATPPAAQPAPVQEPEYWNVVDPAGNIVASETDAIRGWARIAGSYKPTVEGLLGFHDQGWRVLPKVTSPAPQPVPVKTYHDGKPWPVQPKPWVGLSEDEINKLRHLVDWTAEWSYGRFAYELERLLREKNGGAA